MLEPKDLDNMERTANNVLRAYRDRPPQDPQVMVLAEWVLLLLRHQRTPRMLTESQARQLFTAEKTLFTLDGVGKETKRQTLDALCTELYGWSPWSLPHAHSDSNDKSAPLGLTQAHSRQPQRDPAVP